MTTRVSGWQDAMGQFYYAFDVLERLDPNPEYWEGKRGACVGVFQQIIAGHEPRETLCETSSKSCATPVTRRWNTSSVS
ncbi:intraflagellar transport protein 56-like [Patiria miniata]|uniref:Uncharacterized protein n=1 Tax=Patiria miniata TaxID=46514 RepID=A0A914BFH7_PATMI|nr:intraflagellar transport protein 56-like [Patiria miniata]